MTDTEKNQLKISRVILNANGVESIIEKYIAEFYTNIPSVDYKSTYLRLSTDILSTNHISLNSKIEIIRKIFKKIDNSTRIKDVISKGDFKKWLHIRNTFAHGELMSYNGNEKLLYNGEIKDINDLSMDSPFLIGSLWQR